MMMMGSGGEQTSDVKKSRYELLWDATKLTSHGVLIAVSEDEFMNSFPQLTQREKEKLYYIYTRAVAKLQEDIMLEFKLQCEAWEVKEVLEEMEMLIQQQEQDGGLSFRSAPMADAVRELTIKIKHEEVEKLRLLVEQEEEHTAQLRQQRAALKAKVSQRPTALVDMLATVRKERAELLVTHTPNA